MDIAVENITKLYGDQRAVDNLSFVVRTGEVLGFLGPNGAGKTTTMKSIACYLSPSSGDIKVGGFSVLTQPEEVKRRIGYLPEHNPLYLEMGVIDYLKFVAELQGVPRKEIADRIKSMITLTGLTREQHKTIGELSKGYRQRVGLAQAMIHNPEVLILDEPTTGLDPNQIVEIRELIRKIGKEKTVILSSHILAEVEATCDRILIINKGKIVADGTAEELRHAATGKEVVRLKLEEVTLLEAKELLATLNHVDSVTFAANSTDTLLVTSKPEHSSRRQIFELCVANGWIITEMTPSEIKLEDVFRHVTA